MKTIFSILFLAFMSSYVTAQDLMGGQITLQQPGSTGDRSYTGGAILYQDSASAKPHPYIFVDWGDGAHVDSVPLGARALVAPGVYGLYYGLYIHNYANANFYVVSITDTFRMANINNILASGLSELCISTIINTSSESGLQSSTTEWLNYTTITQKEGVYDIYWQGGNWAGDSTTYSLSYPSGNGATNPALPSRINTQTGEITFRPSQPGLYTFAIQAKQWNGGDVIVISNLEFTMKADVVSAVNELKENQAISAYPNPGNGIITFQNSSTLQTRNELTINNVNGKLLRTLQFPKGENKLTADLSDLEAGIYFYSFNQDGEFVAHQKLIILK